MDRRRVIEKEREWHDLYAVRRWPLDRFLYDPPAFDCITQPAMAHLKAPPGERVLDMGSGEGKETLELALRGHHVISIDLSNAQLLQARERVREKSISATVEFVQANAEALPFAANTFRAVYGKAIVHHLDAECVASEVRRILTAGGRATFAEPMAYHPLLWLSRRITPGLRTEDEQPMRLADLERFAQLFEGHELSVHFLLAPAAYFLRLLPKGENAFRDVHRFLQRLDKTLFDRFRFLRGLAWYGLLLLRSGNPCDDGPQPVGSHAEPMLTERG